MPLRQARSRARLACGAALTLLTLGGCTALGPSPETLAAASAPDPSLPADKAAAHARAVAYIRQEAANAEAHSSAAYPPTFVARRIEGRPIKSLPQEKGNEAALARNGAHQKAQRTGEREISAMKAREAALRRLAKERKASALRD